jgi:hypothetical protein
MPAPVAPLLGIALGALFAWAAADELAKGREFGLGSRGLVISALFGLLVLAPISGYFLSLHRDWAFAYLIDTRGLPDFVDPALVLLAAASVPAGFALAASGARSRHSATVAKMLGAALALAAGFVFVTARRLSVQATYAQYHGDFGTEPVAGSTLGYGLLAMAVLLLVGTLWTLHSLSQSSR